jgi:hypothetical protein
MPANAAKYLLSIADICSDSFDFTDFSGKYLPVFIKHEGGGWDRGVYTYRNEFFSITLNQRGKTHNVYSTRIPC